jgi:hypothetical protein
VRRWWAGAALGFATASGCSLATNLDDFAAEDPPAASDAEADHATPDVGIADSGAADGAAGDGADANGGLPNLHPFGTFENGCTGWGTFGSTLAPSEVARTGTGSCLVCGTGTTTSFTADDDGVLPSPPIGAEYLAEAWVRSAPQKTTPPSMQMVLRGRNDAPFVEVEKKFTDYPSPTATWTKLSVKLTITKASQKLNVVVAAEWVNGACFLLDDVAIYRTK